MRYLDEFRNQKSAQNLLRRIKSVSSGKINLMEVCGTHTVTILRSGIKQLLEDKMNLISGPGCPVCVTSTYDLDKAIAIARQDNVILTTFGDMTRVPGGDSSLEKERAQGSDIRVVYSAFDAVKLAVQAPDKIVVFLAIGFETTAPTIASSVKEAARLGLKNFFIISLHKVVPPAMKALLDMGEVNLHGFICPGHVSAIIGSRPYEFVTKDYGIPCVITGFEPLDVLQAIYMLIRQRADKKSLVEIQYTRGVPKPGNPVALKLMDEVFEPCDANWRGIGVIPGSGLKLRERYQAFNIEQKLKINVPERGEPKGCSCGDILRGVKTPKQCVLFGKRCTPEDPVGPCMVSSEGTCAAYYKYYR
ncbi:hydrogenase formation protein HypD [Planctomycetota bacterium]